MPTPKQKSGSCSAGPEGPGLNELTIRRQGSRALTPAQDDAYVLLCAIAERLRDHDLTTVEVMHKQACAMDDLHDGVPVVVLAAYELLETILRNEIVDADRQCTCWLTAAARAFEIRNSLSQAMLVHSLLSLARHPMVTDQARQQVQTQYGTLHAEVSPKAVVQAVPSTETLVDACVTGGVMSAAMLQDILAMAGLGSLGHE
ncbi:MAG: hypothetical protein QG608_104 [Actinomycetota bacterium]|nr:hypothetical protein [Actinomycetota bacterium]